MVKDQKEAEEIKKRCKNALKNCTKIVLNLDNHDVLVSQQEPDILKCEVKWALVSITMNKASGGYGISAELFKILKDYAAKVL